MYVCVYSDVVSNMGQFPLGKGDAYSFLSTGPLCRYATDLLPVFKLISLPEHRNRLQLDQQVSTLLVVLCMGSNNYCKTFSRLK